MIGKVGLVRRVNPSGAGLRQSFRAERAHRIHAGRAPRRYRRCGEHDRGQDEHGDAESQSGRLPGGSISRLSSTCCRRRQGRSHCPTDDLEACRLAQDEPHHAFNRRPERDPDCDFPSAAPPRTRSSRRGQRRQQQPDCANRPATQAAMVCAAGSGRRDLQRLRVDDRQHRVEADHHLTHLVDPRSGPARRT